MTNYYIDAKMLIVFRRKQLISYDAYKKKQKTFKKALTIIKRFDIVLAVFERKTSDVL